MRTGCTHSLHPRQGPVVTLAGCISPFQPLRRISRQFCQFPAGLARSRYAGCPEVPGGAEAQRRHHARRGENAEGPHLLRAEHLCPSRRLAALRQRRNGAVAARGAAQLATVAVDQHHASRDLPVPTLATVGATTDIPLPASRRVSTAATAVPPCRSTKFPGHPGIPASWYSGEPGRNCRPAALR